MLRVFFSHRTFCHPNIVRCYGISIEKTINQKEHLNIFMEICDCSLEDIILCDRHPMEMCQCSQQRRQTCHVFPEKDRNQQGYVEAWGFFMQTLEGVVNGLIYLHNEGFVHRDIKLSNILVRIVGFFLLECLWFIQTPCQFYGNSLVFPLQQL